MRILVCDDDKFFAQRMALYIENFFEGHGISVSIDICSNAGQVFKLQNLEAVRLAFLDVDMPVMDGIVLGAKLRQFNPEICLIYVSAFMEFSMDGYEVKAFRYLIKKRVDEMLPKALEAYVAEAMGNGPYLTINRGRDLKNIPLKQIYYIECDQRKLDVYGDTPHDPIEKYYCKLSELPENIFDNGFIQVSRSFVVNMRYVKRLSAYKMEMRNGVEIGVSRAAYGDIRNAYLEWRAQYGDADLL